MYGQTLNEMRVNYDGKVKIKEISDSNNPLIARRMKKTKTGEANTATTSSTASANAEPSTASASASTETTAAAASTGPGNESAPKAAEGGLIVEDLTRESSMISVDGNTPTNSRPSSPKRMVL